MERLTFYDDFGKACYRYNGAVYQNEIAKRLAAYEDTGLAPEKLDDYAPNDCITKEAAMEAMTADNLNRNLDSVLYDDDLQRTARAAKRVLATLPVIGVRPVSEIEKIIENLQEQADIYNARAQELLVEEGGQVSQYTWAVSLRETYRRMIKTLDDLIS